MYQLAKTPYSHSLAPQPLATTYLLCRYGFTNSGCFIAMESYDMWPFVTSFFHLACCVSFNLDDHVFFVFYFINVVIYYIDF